MTSLEPDPVPEPVPPAGSDPAELLPGALVELRIGSVAHGGHCVARAAGRVVFVRHALPGELVVARVTEGRPGDRYVRADAIDVLEASADRVDRPCPLAVPGGCGGCDWQHAALPAQRRLKAAVVREQLQRLAGLDVEVEVVPVDGEVPSGSGLGWRTRVRLTVGPDGRAGLRRHRSHQVQPLRDCPIAHPATGLAELLGHRWPAGAAVDVVAPAGGAQRLVLVDGRPQPESGPPRVVEQAAGRSWRVSGSGFWQVHPGAADTLVAAVAEELRPAAGEHLLDLYAGVGLFAGALAPALGPGGRVDAVESDGSAVRDARRNLHDLPTVQLHQDRVDRWLGRAPRDGGVVRCDLVVLDPPRSGARRAVVERIAALRPRAVAYVACDPAALARDVATFASLGYALTGLRAYDLFPMTAHVECVARLEPV